MKKLHLVTGTVIGLFHRVRRANIDTALHWASRHPVWCATMFSVIGGALLFLILTNIGNSDFARNVLLLAFACAGFPIIVWRGIALDRRSRAAEKQAETDALRRRTDTFVQSAKLFYNPGLALRMAGMHGLWNLAVELPEEFHVQVLKMMCQFIRNPSGLREYEETSTICERPDVAEAILLLKSRSKEQIGHEGKLSIDLTGAMLDGVNWDNANMDRINFTNSSLMRTSFNGAKLNRANFANANLDGAKFYDAELKRAIFIHANLQNATFFGATLRGSKFSYSNLRFSRYNRADLSHSTIMNCVISGTTFFMADMRSMRMRCTLEDMTSSIKMDDAAVNDVRIDTRSYSDDNSSKQASIFEAAVAKSLLIADNQEVRPRIDGMPVNVAQVIDEERWKMLRQGPRPLYRRRPYDPHPAN